jgi:hypothetical protein
MARRNGMLVVSRVILFGTPLLWIVLALLHPHEPEEADRWLFVHFAQLALTPFLAFAVWTLLDGIHSEVATVSRIALVAWVVFFSAYDSVAGIATGLLSRYAEGLPGEEQAAVTSAIGYLFNDGLLTGGAVVLGAVTTLAWPAAVISGGIALRRSGARLFVAVALGVSALFAFHASYPAVIGLLSLLASAAMTAHERAQAEVRQSGSQTGLPIFSDTPTPP